MRFTRLFLGLFVVLVALWVIIGEQMSGTSGDAVVNARIITLRADTAGRLSVQNRELGTRIEAGEVLASVDDTLVDVIRLNDLRMERRFAAAETARTEAVLGETRALLEAMTTRGETYRQHRLDELRTRLNYARDRLARLEAQPELSSDAQRLIDAVEPDQDRLPAEPLLADLALSHARERVETLEIELAAAEAGVFLGDGYNDAPNAEQYAAVLEAEIASLTAQLDENRSRESALTQRVEREEVRVNALRGGQIAAPVSGLLWTILQANGVTVQRGDPVMTMVDCSAMIVTLPVSESVYNRLEIGDAATMRLSGRKDILDATVARLAGSGAATVYEHLAVAPSQQHLERFDVTLSVPALNADTREGCLVGRTGRAFFEARPLDGLRGLWGDN